MNCAQIFPSLNDKSNPYFYKYSVKHGIPEKAARAGIARYWEADGPQPLQQRPLVALPPRRLLPDQLHHRTLQRPALARKLGTLHQVSLFLTVFPKSSLSDPIFSPSHFLLLLNPRLFTPYPGCGPWLVLAGLTLGLPVIIFSKEVSDAVH